MEIAPNELIPNLIDEGEAFARAIFSPYHLKKNGIEIKPNAFRFSEISVNRTKYSTGNFCKSKAKKIEHPEANPPKVYRGFAVVSYIALSQAGAFVKASKQIEDAAHADIYFPESAPDEFGRPQSAEMNSIVDTFLPHTKYFADPSPALPTWEGEIFWVFRTPY